MTKMLAMAAALALAGAATAADDKPADKELAKLTGTWNGVSVVHDGKEAPKERAESLKLVVKGAKYTLHVGDTKIEGTHKLDASKKPKEIDAVRTSGPDKGEKMLGVYELTEDTFTVCFGAPGKDRPTSLKSEEGSGTRLLKLKRVKKSP